MAQHNVGVIAASPACIPVINELLCYIQNKMDNVGVIAASLACLTIIKESSTVLHLKQDGPQMSRAKSSSNSTQIESLKTIPYDACEGIEGERMKKRKQTNKHLYNHRPFQ